jgi:hypothetical protein
MKKMNELITKTIQNAKSEFKSYLSRKNKSDLIDKVDELFNYSVKSENKVVNVVLTNNSRVFFNENINIDELTLLNEKIRKIKVNNFELSLLFNEKQIFNKSINSFNDLKGVIDENKEQIFNEIGYLNLTLIQNDTHELLDLKVNINDLNEVNDLLKQNSDFIYDKYVEEDIKGRQSFYQEGSESTSIGIPLVDLLTGNVIHSENDEILSDEFGNCLSFE